MARIPIVSQYNSCKNSFDKLLKHVETSSHQACGQGLWNEFGRFRVWAGNAGAHRKGRVSLDHRLRDATHIYEELTKLLTELKKDLDEGGSKQPGVLSGFLAFFNNLNLHNSISSSQAHRGW